MKPPYTGIFGYSVEYAKKLIEEADKEEQRNQEKALALEIARTPIAFTEPLSLKTHSCPIIADGTRINITVHECILYDRLRANPEYVAAELNLHVQSETAHWAINFHHLSEVFDEDEWRELGVTISQIKGTLFEITRATIVSVEPSEPGYRLPPPSQASDAQSPVLKQLTETLTLLKQIAAFKEWVAIAHPEIAQDGDLAGILEEKISAIQHKEFGSPPRPANSPLKIISEMMAGLKTVEALSAFEQFAAVAYPALRANEDNWKRFSNRLDTQKFQILFGRDDQ